MSLDQLVYDHRKLMWIRERRRFLAPSPPSPPLPDDDKPLSAPQALERIAEDVRYVEDLIKVHRHDLEEVLTDEEWQVMQAGIRRFQAGYQAAAEAARRTPSDQGAALGRFLTDAAIVAQIDGFINGLVYGCVRELNLSPAGPQASVLEYAHGIVAGDSLESLPEKTASPV